MSTSLLRYLYTFLYYCKTVPFSDILRYFTCFADIMYIYFFRILHIGKAYDISNKSDDDFSIGAFLLFLRAYFLTDETEFLFFCKNKSGLHALTKSFFGILSLSCQSATFAEILLFYILYPIVLCC